MEAHRFLLSLVSESQLQQLNGFKVRNRKSAKEMEVNPKYENWRCFFLRKKFLVDQEYQENPEIWQKNH